MGVTWLEKDELLPTVSAHLRHVDIVLDIGCGIQPQELITPKVHICCEPFAQYLQILQERRQNDPELTWVLIQATLSEAVHLFPSKSVDTVFLNDVIEHIEKAEALESLKVAEGLARHQIAVFTPLGFMPQCHPDGKDAWGLDGGAWQEHKSGWQPEDFDSTWDVFATKVYHTADNMGRELIQPFGALWAIKSFGEAPVRASSRKIAVTRRQRIHSGVDKVLNLLHRLKSWL